MTKPRMFRRPIREGQPIALRGFSAGVNDLTKAVTNLQVENGTVEWANGYPLIKIDINSLFEGLGNGVLVIEDGQLTTKEIAEFACPDEE